MFRTMRLCIVFVTMMTETWSFITFQTSGMFGQGQSRQPQTPVDSRMVRNALNTGQMLVQLGKQELRELSDLAGVQVGGDLLFGGYGNRNPSLGFSLGSNLNSKPSSSATTMDTQKALTSNNVPSIPSTLQTVPQASKLARPTNVNSAGSNNELVYKPDTLSLPMSLEISELPQNLAISAPAPPYKGTFNPLAGDTFHAAFSILNPTTGAKKTADPIMLPLQFYSPEALRKINLQEKPGSSTPSHQSVYDNFDTW